MRSQRRVKVYNTKRHPCDNEERSWHLLDISTGMLWFVAPSANVHSQQLPLASDCTPAPEEILAPIGTQEVWAAG